MASGRTYSDEIRAQALRMAAEGFYDKDIATAVGATREAVQGWRYGAGMVRKRGGKGSGVAELLDEVTPVFVPVVSTAMCTTAYIETDAHGRPVQRRFNG